MAFATPADLGLLLDQTIGASDPRALLLLDLASTAIRAALTLTIDEVSDDTITLDGNEQQTIILPEYPVTAITSVTLDGTLLVEDEDYAWTSNGILRRLGVNRTWGTLARSIAVVYTHGYATSLIPAAVRNVCLQAAARAWSNPEGYGQETIGRYSVTYSGGSARSGGTPATVILTDEELVMLRGVL